jgi:hypothetical protein
MNTKLQILAATIACMLLVAGIGLAQGDYDLSWWTVDAGGRTFSTGGGYTLGSTIGQPDANVLHGGDYTLAGGFWPGGETVVSYRYIYLPLVLK